jgi:F420-non-reducing hydrogenase iron-sulfur subunit
MPKEASGGGFEPEIVLFYCEHSVNSGLGKSGPSLKVSGLKVRSVILPCSSKIEVGNLLKILEEGADAVEVVGCPEADCRFFVGSDRAEKRIAYARSLISDAGMGAERIGMTRGKDISGERLREILSLRAEAVKAMGPNPMKKKSVKP